jgi:hypothetical protein
MGGSPFVGDKGFASMIRIDPAIVARQFFTGFCGNPSNSA